MNSRIQKILRMLSTLYPNPKPFLRFRTPFESLCATMLSAQCTDERVNRVTPKLFSAAPTPKKMLALGQKKLRGLIHSTGFFRAKSKNLLAASRMILEKFGGRVPADLEALQKLPGVGRKTASVVMSQAFGVPAFPVDRHVFRVANRLGLAQAKTPEKTDEQLRKKIPKKIWIPLHIRLISHGRTLCRPKPKCGICPLLSVCPEGKKRVPRQSGVFMVE